MYKLESPSFNDALCQAWFNLAQWFLRRRFLNLVNVFSLLYSYLSLKIGIALHLNKFETHLPKDVLCSVWLKLTNVSLKDENVKNQTDGQTDDRQMRQSGEFTNELSSQVR